MFLSGFIHPRHSAGSKPPIFRGSRPGQSSSGSTPGSHSQLNLKNRTSHSSSQRLSTGVFPGKNQT